MVKMESEIEQDDNTINDIAKKLELVSNKKMIKK